ncbi:MAG: protein translocase subunit SecF [Actinobacteria bacterium]|nr:protein translocase subunit SecF [Actinomycetota bacterium]
MSLQETSPDALQVEVTESKKNQAFTGAFRRLYHGETQFDFMGRRKTWFSVSAAIILVGLASMLIQGLNLGIDFKGGSSWTVQVSGADAKKVEAAVVKAGLVNPTVLVLGNRTVQVEGDLVGMSAAKQTSITKAVTAALADYAKVKPAQVSESKVGPTWGGEVTHRAIIAFIAFLIAVGLYISIRFDLKMAMAAFLAMIHDILITLGIYSLAGFEVTPDTVIAVLTILGYSLYDTVVVFDRIRDNTKMLGGSGRYTFDELVNLSMNQTLARSLNTSLVAILPVLSVLLIGAEVLGATTLQNYGVALVVGLFAGAYSSIFIASPFLAVLKNRESRWRAVEQRVSSRAGRGELTRGAQGEAGSRARGPKTNGLIAPGSAGSGAAAIAAKAPKRRSSAKRHR